MTEPLQPSMTHILYKSPRGQTRIDPDREFLHHAIYKQPWLEWTYSANNEATLDILVPTTKDDRYRIRGRLPVEGAFRIACELPSLLIKQPESDEFFILWCDRMGGTAFVPYHRESNEELVIDHCGGDDFPIPRACLVSADVAFQIVQQFVSSHQKAEIVSWVKWDDVAPPYAEQDGDF